jgi:hypothetical protein
MKKPCLKFHPLGEMSEGQRGSIKETVSSEQLRVV